MAKRASKNQTSKRRVKAGTRRRTSVKATIKRRNAARATASRKPTNRRSAPPSTLESAATAIRGAVAGVVAGVSARLPGKSDQPDAIALLEAEHRRLEGLLHQGEETTARAVKGRTALLKTLTTELAEHELIEEKVLYPALEAHREAKDIVLEGFQEHHVADLILTELHAVAKDDEQWGAKFKVLKENIEHHIEEEEGKMFRIARGVLGNEELQMLGARMAALKADARSGHRKRVRRASR